MVAIDGYMPETYISKGLKAVAAFIFIFGMGAATLYTVRPSIQAVQNTNSKKELDSTYNLSFANWA